MGCLGPSTCSTTAYAKTEHEQQHRKGWKTGFKNIFNILVKFSTKIDLSTTLAPMLLLVDKTTVFFFCKSRTVLVNPIFYGKCKITVNAVHA